MPFDKNDPANIECPCCHGAGVLRVHDPESLNDWLSQTARVVPYSEVKCCHCSGSGVIPPDMRSDNEHE